MPVKDDGLKRDKSGIIIENSMIKAMDRKFKECFAIMEKKEYKYAHKGDSLSKYKQFTAFTGLPPTVFAIFLVFKQWITLWDACENPKEVSLAEVKKLTTDIINYMVIIEELWHKE
jgi:hypothetical protein